MGKVIPLPGRAPVEAEKKSAPKYEYHDFWPPGRRFVELPRVANPIATFDLAADDLAKNVLKAFLAHGLIGVISSKTNLPLGMYQFRKGKWIHLKDGEIQKLIREHVIFTKNGKRRQAPQLAEKVRFASYFMEPQEDDEEEQST
jgi:hypothetical protein